MIEGTAGSRAAGAPQRLNADKRQREILAALERDGRVEVTDLALRLGASEETIRRDLRRLEQESLLIRAHGGAVRPQPMHLPMSEGAERILVERVAAELPREGAVYLDGDHLAEQLIPLLPEDGELDLLTPLVDVAIAASVQPGVRVLSLGGHVDSRGVQSGDWTRDVLESVRPDAAVIFAGGCTDAGELTARPADAAVRRLALRRARRTVLVLSGSGGSPAEFAVYARVADFDTVIADAEAARHHSAPLEGARLVTVAGAP